jgi:hypothetical protein
VALETKQVGAIACRDAAVQRRCGARRPRPPMGCERAAHVAGQRGSGGARAGDVGDWVGREALVRRGRPGGKAQCRGGSGLSGSEVLPLGARAGRQRGVGKGRSKDAPGRQRVGAAGIGLTPTRFARPRAIGGSSGLWEKSMGLMRGADGERKEADGRPRRSTGSG